MFAISAIKKGTWPECAEVASRADVKKITEEDERFEDNLEHERDFYLLELGKKMNCKKKVTGNIPNNKILKSMNSSENDVKRLKSMNSSGNEWIDYNTENFENDYEFKELEIPRIITGKNVSRSKINNMSINPMCTSATD